MSALPALMQRADDFASLRRDIHAHPELGLVEHRTAALVAEQLASWGIDVHAGVGGTGVVGVLRAGNGSGSIGLRADMDALPIHEASGAAWSSTTPGLMHACGHDGHTTMLLAAAHHLAQTRAFNGTVTFIFQPGEEGCGGALAMLRDGLFDRFPCDTIYGLHNQPGMAVGQYRMTPGPAMAGGGFFDVTLTGRGAHAARPEAGIDPVPAVCQVVSALQSIVSRSIAPDDPVVVSITKLGAGNAHNVIPQTASFGGTFRCMKRETLALVRARLEEMTCRIAEGFGTTASVTFGEMFAPLVNTPALSAFAADAASAIVGAGAVDADAPPVMGSEDFAFMLEQVPGAFIRVGNGDSAGLHHPAYDFNDAATPYGSALLVELVERSLPRGTIAA
ncbi:metal-dependent amidase [Ameyamaea chiangmaiensis NBRC 103196]|uniref:Amidohydrolase n=1 Tax=Ameyamaea chiangmaiensis TaxID=442969 RepID=A0A850P8N4_9PROT|nr:amidohydrolase [Ameyamaea chiangmaiensis]MBS4075695.1 amidohydrolase [Ameyamaea chiangmaiensis]NVN40268.1 amidohydrolase [Ameyamaea chiangmaiensis]GBQ70481.1 metal-dependent amidase [Ameyamaea chiangmaiensis NBRC 103196]